MRKQTCVLAVLALLIALIFMATSGILSTLSGIVAVGLGICAGLVQSADFVDENYYLIPDPDRADQQARTATQLMPEASLSKY